MKAGWIVDRYMLDLAAERGCGSIADAVLRAGMEVHVVTSDGHMSRDMTLPAWDGRCVVLYGSFRFVRRVERQLKASGRPALLPGAFARVENLSYSTFGAHLGDVLLNDDFVILPFGEFRRRRLRGWGGRCFLRPDAVTKSFAGMVVTEGDFDHEMNSLEKLQLVMPEDLVVAAAARDIRRETRFVVVDGEVVSGSTYGWNGSDDIGLPIDKASAALARDVASRAWQPDRAYTCDIALFEDDVDLKARLIELNSFSCAGLYGCDLDAVVAAVSDAAEDEWEQCGGLV
jgi:hypothetical protein